VRLPPFAEHPAWGPAPPSRAVVPRAPEPRRGKGLESGRRGREGGKVQVPRSNAGTSPRVVLSLGGGDDGRALAVGSTAVQYRGVDRGRDPGKLRRGRGGDRASTRGNGCSGGPRTPCGARTRCRYAVARKARTDLPWEIPLPGGLGTLGGRAWPWALPRQREKGLPGRGVSESAGRGAPKEGRGPKGSTGEGTPRRDPGGPAGRSRPQGRVGGHQSATATAVPGQVGSPSQ
jgi:hypothetical protein